MVATASPVSIRLLGQFGLGAGGGVADAAAPLPLTRRASVTLCYQRPSRPLVWPYNLFCMVHARFREEAYAVIDELNLLADTGLMQQAVLFSKRCFKQRGAVFSRHKETN